MEEAAMRNLERRDTQGAQLSTTAVAAIVTGIGVVMLCLLIALILLLVRAVRKHKQLLADLDERGVYIAQAQKDARGESVTRPRTVLRRNTILPFNKSGWGALPSVETFRSTESVTVPAHYAPVKPTEEVKKASRLSWPCSTRRLSGHNIPMKKIKVSRLSTVIEDPKLSPLVPVMNNPHLNGSRPSLALSTEYTSRSSLPQSLMQYHPAFRDQAQEADPTGAGIQTSSGTCSQNGPAGRLQRARSVAEFPSLQTSRPQLRARSTSLCSQISGKVPDVILPPLPLDIARTKNEAEKRNQLKHAPSKLSISSFGSAETPIMSRPSPIAHLNKTRPQKITKPNAKGSKFAGARPFRDTLDLRVRVPGARNSIQGSTGRSSTVSMESREQRTNSSGSRFNEINIGPACSSSRVQSTDMSKLIFTPTGTIQTQNFTPPKRKIKMQVTSSGSPERQGQSAVGSRSLTSGMRSPKRQHSQASSRSSGGNPFQWDPTPLSPTGKPSALKGSPSARQGHRRKNSVRISLVPTIHGPPAERTPSTSLLVESKENPSEGTSKEENKVGLGLGLTNTRSLPTPPSSSTFAPDLKFKATSLRASLTPNSPTLPLVRYDQPNTTSPLDRALPPLPTSEQKRSSNGSCFSLSQFPTTPSIIEPDEVNESNQLPFLNPQSYEHSGGWVPETPLLEQYPFESQESTQTRSPSPSSMIRLEEYDPEQPNCIYQTPANATSRVFQSAFDTIPEESSANSKKTMDLSSSRYDDSPPVSPKTVSPPRFTLNDGSVYILPHHASAMQEEPCHTIDPAILSKDAFSLLNSGFSEVNGNIFEAANSSRSSIGVPTTPGSARSMFEPLLESALPPNLPSACDMDSPTLAHVGGESPLSFGYSSPSQSRSSSPTQHPMAPSSPRPKHAQLPTPGVSINFEDMPKLKPGPRGPRCSPPRPLRTSIAALRRMNSDAADAKNSRTGRGERRYLRLGRGDSVHLPGEESWLDEFEDDDAVELDEAEGRRLVGNVLEGWEDEGRTVLDLDEGNTSTLSDSTIKPERNVKMSTEESNTTGGAQRSSNSIWEDGEKFWTSSTPPPSSPPGSPSNYRTDRQALDSSPGAASTSRPTTPTFESWSRKRDFQVAKDYILPSTENLTSNSNPGSPSRKSRDDGSNGGARRGSAAHRNRKRCILGIGTPNVRVQVTNPNGQVVGGLGIGGDGNGNGHGTPGLIYDSQGFLIF